MCRYSARMAGSYALTVACSTTGEQLTGSPFPLRVGPAAAAAARCTATIAVLVDGEARAPEAQTPTLTLPAGAEVVVAVAAADEFGNALADLGGQAVSVEAQGPRQAALVVAPRAGVPGAFSAALTAAGSYLVRAHGSGLAGRERAVLHLQSAPVLAPATLCRLCGKRSSMH